MDRNISASRVKSYSSCPREYFHKYKTDAEPVLQNGIEYLTLGLRVHEAIEAVLASDDTPPLDEKELLSASILNTYEDLDEHEVPSKLYKTGKDCCEVAGRFLSSEQPDIADIEQRIEFAINRDDFVTGVTAIIDVATEKEIWDWKTGRIRDETPHEEKIQGSVYMAAYYNHYGHQPEKIRFVYLKEEEQRVIEPNDDDWEYMLSHAKNLVNSEDNDQFQAKTGSQCYFCSFAGSCSAYETGCGNVPYEEY